MFDSNVRIKNPDFNKELRLVSKLLKKNKIKNAICLLCSKNKNYNIDNFKKEINKYKNLIPAIELKNNSQISLNKIVKNKIKLVKIHPRNMGVSINNQEFYIDLSKRIFSSNLNLMFCTLNSFSKYFHLEEPLELLISKISNLNKRNKIILMHAGGTSMLRFYEKFRFDENIIFDLSYTIFHYKKTTLEKDIIFLLKKFDKRVVIGSDYPDISYKKYLDSVKKILAASKLDKKKKENIIFNNLNKLKDKFYE